MPDAHCKYVVICFLTHYVLCLAFTELQTDMTEMTADIQALHGLPFYEYNRYCVKVLFPPLQSEYEHPVMRPLEVMPFFSILLRF